MIFFFISSTRIQQYLTLHGKGGVSSLPKIDILLEGKGTRYVRRADMVLSDKNTEIWIYISQEIQKYNFMDKVWICVVKKGSHIEAFAFLAEFLAERFGFEDLTISQIEDSTISRVLSEFPFVVKGELKLEDCKNLKEKDVLLWAELAQKSFTLISKGPMKLSRAVFDNEQVPKTNFSIFTNHRVFPEVSYGPLPRRGRNPVCEFNDDHLEKLRISQSSIFLKTCATRVTFNGLKNAIDKWTTREPQIQRWRFPIDLDHAGDIKRLREDLSVDHNVAVHPGRNETWEVESSFTVALKKNPHRRVLVKFTEEYPQTNPGIVTVDVTNNVGA